MKPLPKRCWIPILPGVAAALLCGETARACSVCFGDPDSTMAQGALSGVLVLGGVVVGVLAGIAATALCWMVKARR
ncbi:MAG: hypothetical protein ACYSUI_15715 [Planctomycetota bacterium]|jgi:hypothetical protein